MIAAIISSLIIKPFHRLCTALLAGHMGLPLPSCFPYRKSTLLDQAPNPDAMPFSRSNDQFCSAHNVCLSAQSSSQEASARNAFPEYESAEEDIFDIPYKRPNVESLQRWKKATLVLNAARRYRYLDEERRPDPSTLLDQAPNPDAMPFSRSNDQFCSTHNVCLSAQSSSQEASTRNTFPEYESAEEDIFDIPYKRPNIESLQRWKKATLVLNAARRYRYLDEERRPERVRKLRASAHAMIVINLILQVAASISSLIIKLHCLCMALLASHMGLLLPLWFPYRKSTLLDQPPNPDAMSFSCSNDQFCSAHNVFLSGQSSFPEYESAEEDIPYKRPSIESLQQWKKATLVLNAARRYQYLDEERRLERVRKLRGSAHAVIAINQILQVAAESKQLAPGDPEMLVKLMQDRQSESLHKHGGVKRVSRLLGTNLKKAAYACSCGWNAN